jgi:hypothetical protein
MSDSGDDLEALTPEAIRVVAAVTHSVLPPFP